MAIGIDQLVIALIVAVVGVVVGYLLRKQVVESKVAEAETLAGRILHEAEKGAETKRREAELEALRQAIARAGAPPPGNGLLAQPCRS